MTNIIFYCSLSCFIEYFNNQRIISSIQNINWLVLNKQTNLHMNFTDMQNNGRRIRRNFLAKRKRFPSRLAGEVNLNNFYFSWNKFYCKNDSCNIYLNYFIAKLFLVTFIWTFRYQSTAFWVVICIVRGGVNLQHRTEILNVFIQVKKLCWFIIKYSLK